jgi:glucose-1-phosphate adenylyltransferase
MGSDYYSWEDPGAASRAGPRPAPGIGEGSTIEGDRRPERLDRQLRDHQQGGIQEGEGPGFYIRDGIVVILKNAEIPTGHRPEP